MEILQLRYFREVARVGQMTKAAEGLGITQPSLSKIISRLEQELGVPLFDRQGRTIHLNRFGAEFLKHVESIFSELEEGQRKVRDMAGIEAGEVRVAAASLYWMPDLLHRFRLEYPAINFQLLQRSLPEITQCLDAGACDFGFQSLPLIKTGIEWQTLLTEEIYLIVSPSHPIANKKSIPLREVADEAMVLEQSGSGLRELVDDFCRRANFKPRIVCEIDEPATLLEFVKAGIGIAFSPALMLKQIEEHDLKAIRLTNPKCERSFGFAWRREQYLSQAARRFREYVIAYFTGLKE